MLDGGVAAWRGAGFALASGIENPPSPRRPPVVDPRAGFVEGARQALARRDGAPSPELVRLYSAWASGGIGLCVTGNVMIDARAIGEPGNVVVEDATHLVELQSWAQAATANNTQCWANQQRW